MTRREVLRAAPLALAASWDLRAADFWDKTPDFRDWSMENVQQMLFKSPWVSQVALSPPGGSGGPGGGGGGGRGGGGFGGAGGGAGGGGGLGGGGGDTDGGGGFGGGGGGGGGFGGGGGGGRMGGGGGGFAQRPLYVRWQTARPVKEAILRSRMGAEGGEITADQQKFLDAPGEHYIVAVSGFPARMSRLAENAGRLAPEAHLERKGKDPLAAVKAEGRANEQAVELYFFFPKTDPIVLDDKQVEFALTLRMGGGPGAGQGRRQPEGEAGQEAEQSENPRRGGGLPIKARFKLKDLVYKGELAL
ncbi:MAG: hypothetical protein GC160_01765 [Acidobacteria bacterium]|nr:hypothetical protein [Acidobacteriota bacterium]